MVSSKAVLGLCAGVSATLFIGYCIYFDKKRHNDPDFKKKLRERKFKVMPFYLNYKNFKLQGAELKKLHHRQANDVRQFFLI